MSVILALAIAAWAFASVDPNHLTTPERRVFIVCVCGLAYAVGAIWQAVARAAGSPEESTRG